MKTFLLSIAFLGLIVSSAPHLAAAQTQCDPTQGYCLLEPLPLQQPNMTDAQIKPQDYIPDVIRLAIGIAGALTVLMIVVGGVQYVSSDAYGKKEQGRKTIEDALTGLALVMVSWLILNTLNPRILTFDLSIAGQAVGPSFLGTTSGQDNTNTALPCPNCGPIPSGVPTKPPAAFGSTNGACAFPGPCTVNQTLATELQTLTSKTGGFSGANWQITESYPPTVLHGSACHDAGTCVDTALTNPTDAQIASFLTAVSNSGFSSYVYEACDLPHAGFTTNRLSQLLGDPTLKGFNIMCEPTTTGENAHLNM